MNSNTSCLVGLKPVPASPMIPLPRNRVDPNVSCSSCTEPDRHGEKCHRSPIHMHTDSKMLLKTKSKIFDYCNNFTWVCLTRNSKKLPCSKERKSLTWKFLVNFFSKEAMWAKVKVEFWEDRLSLRYCFTSAERHREDKVWQSGALLWTNTQLVDIIRQAQKAETVNPARFTFAGEGCGGFVLCFSMFTGFGCLLFGHQVLWDSQGASTDGQLKQSPCQTVVWHLKQETLDLLDLKLNRGACQKHGIMSNCWAGHLHMPLLLFREFYYCQI